MGQEPFSIRNAIRPRVDVFVYENIPEEAREWLITIIGAYWYDWSYNRLCLIQGKAPPQRKSDFGIGHLDSDERKFTQALSKAEWYEIYDLIEHIYTALPIASLEGMIKGYFEHAVNDILVNLRLGYRMENGEIERILHSSTTEALSAASDLLVTDSRFSSSMKQMTKAVDHLSDRPEPDTHNCAKDAVGSLEGVAQIISGKPKTVLSELLKQPPLNQIPPTLKGVLDKLYAYRGATPGVSHAQVGTEEPSVEEAEFVLATSASAMVYLVKRFPLS